MTARHTLTLAASAGNSSPEHKRFQTLRDKIAKARARLQAWQEQLPLFAQTYAAQVAPLQKQLAAERKAFALQLETLQLSHKWSRADKETLSEWICDLSGALLETADEPDPELKALYNRHSDTDFDSEAQQDLEAMKAMIETMGDLDLGDGPVESIEDLMHTARQQMAQRAEEAQAHAASQAPPRACKPRRKTAAEKRAEEDAHRISQTVREVYRKLASALHPDRAPAGMGDADRAARTALMQRANSAYEASDLLTLLELQLQIEQVDLAQVAGVPAEQVRHFNKLLAEQLRELEAEMDERQDMFGASYGILLDRRVAPDKLGLLIKDEVRELLAAQLAVEHDRRLLRAGPAAVKPFLKQWRAQQREGDFDIRF